VDLGGDVFRLTPNAVSADQGDTLRGFGGNDMMFGGSGDDLLDGGTGQDTMTGGPGADHFVFAPGYGRDIVNDFVTSGGVADRIDLTAFTGVYTLIDVLSHTTQVGADARLRQRRYAEVAGRHQGQSQLGRFLFRRGGPR